MKYALVIDTRSAYTDLHSFYKNKAIAYQDLSLWLEEQLGIRFQVKLAFGLKTKEQSHKIDKLIQFFHNNYFETYITPFEYNTQLGIRCAQLLMTDHDLVLVTAMNDHANVAKFARNISRQCYLVNCRPTQYFRSLAPCFSIPESVLLDKVAPSPIEQVPVPSDIPSDDNGNSSS